MASICIRTFVVYLLITCSIRLMGKRQIGELEVSELVTTLLLSELAAMPIDDPDIPLLFSLIPIFLIVALELLTSDLKNRITFLKRIFESRPTILINRGALSQKEMQKMRISMEELLSALRQQGVTDPDDVYYAILEQNGSLSVILKADKQPLTVSDAGVNTVERGITHALIIDGHVNQKEVRSVGKDEEWLYRTLSRYHSTVKETFLLSLDDAGHVTLIKKNRDEPADI